MSRPHKVRQLKHATLRDAGPFNSTPKLRGSAAEGIRFQRRVQSRLDRLAHIGDVLHDQWIEFSDFTGRHWAQLDSAIVSPERVLIVESKLSLSRIETARIQLDKLYRPLCERIFQKPTALLVAFKHWVPGVEIELVEDPRDFMYFEPRSLAEPRGWHLLT